MCCINCFTSTFLMIQIYLCLNANAKFNDSKECDPNNNIESVTELLSDTSTDYLFKRTKLSPWCIPPNLNTDIEPWKFKEKNNSSLPWNYHYTFNILEVEKVNDQMQTISIVMYFRIKWMEPRLEINFYSKDWNETDFSDGGISYPAKILDKFWYPDLEIEGIKIFKTQTLLKEMSNAQVYKSRHLRYGVRAEVTVSCAMNFENYPLDQQNCPFRVLSYFSTDNTVSCTSEFTYSDETQRKLQYSISINPLPEAQSTVIGPFGNFSACGFSVSLIRKRSQTFCQVYLTSILFVIVSWVSFLIKPEVVPGRIGLLVTIFLVLVNIFDGAKSVAPVSENLNAIDLYILFCIVLVFLALIEYAFVLSKEKLNLSRVESVKNILEEVPTSTNNAKANNMSQNCVLKMRLDTLALIVFPILFIFFNIIYWALYI